MSYIVILMSFTAISPSIGYGQTRSKISQYLKDYSVRVMHCGLLLLFTFYSNTTNSDKNTLFGTFFDKNQTKRARIIKGWFKYMTDCKNFPDHLIYSSRKMAASRSLSPRIPGVTLIL
jgi:hypothetical protein